MLVGPGSEGGEVHHHCLKQRPALDDCLGAGRGEGGGGILNTELHHIIKATTGVHVDTKMFTLLL